jgi:uncharacterized lipoprotein YddW (UPF0748 family)
VVSKKVNGKNQISKLGKTGFLIGKLQLFLLIFCHILPVSATEDQPIFSIIQTPENTQQWQGISKRLQAAGVKYCVIPLDSVRSMGDWGDRNVVFLPNVETLTPIQAIALEEWMSKGGRLIATGPVATLSSPGVRQLMQSLLGGYWGFSLNTPQKLERSPVKTQRWADDSQLFGQVSGGVIVPNNVTGAAAAVWNSQDDTAAVVATERTTFLGWRWGVDNVATVDLDTAWLQATLKRYQIKGQNFPRTVAGANSQCSTQLATLPSSVPKPKKPTQEQQPRVSKITPPVSKQNNLPTPPPTRNLPPRTTATLPISPYKSDEAIDRIQERFRLDVVPNSQAPLSSTEVFTLQEELKNLIGRVESTHLAALANNSGVGGNLSSNPIYTKAQPVGFAPVKAELMTARTQESLTRAKQTVNNLPQLVAQGKYAQARQQWLAAKASVLREFPVDRRLAQPEIRAMWLDRGTIVRAGSEDGLAKIFDRMAEAGINTVFFETVNSSYTIYPSKVAPQQNPLIRGWDPLAAAVKLGKSRGIEIHAWVWVFAAGNRNHNKLLNLPSDYPGPVIAAHPTWANRDRQGNITPVGQTKPFFDHGNPQVQKYLLDLYEEIVTRYPVDGLQLDYIRYPFQDPARGQIYGYGAASRSKFQQLTGVDPVNITPSQREMWQKWTEFRTQQVDNFVAQVSEKLRKKRPNLIISAAVFPLPEQERIQKIQQDWEVWAKRGDVDMIVPMTYALDTIRFQRLAQPWVAVSKLGSSLLVPGIRLLSLPTLGAVDQIQLVRDLPVNGYALFATENLHNELHKVFSSTQGRKVGSKNEPIAYRQPFATAAIRYTALQREWQVVEQNKQLDLSGNNLSTFKTQAESLASILNKLAAEPKQDYIVAARATLTRFQSRFRMWMEAHAQENPYQVRVWENRLIAIEKLLRYGERAQSRK